MTHNDWKTQEWRRIRGDLQAWINKFDTTDPLDHHIESLVALASCADDLQQILDGTYER